MSRIAPKPVISQVVRTWKLQPELTVAVVEDMDGGLWIEEKCPVGTQYWTIEQAAELAVGTRSGRALDEAVMLGCERLALNRLPALPVFGAELEASPRRCRRAPCAVDRRLARV